jgi:hypothetical protein
MALFVNYRKSESLPIMYVKPKATFN